MRTDNKCPKILASFIENINVLVIKLPFKTWLYIPHTLEKI